MGSLTRGYNARCRTNHAIVKASRDPGLCHESRCYQQPPERCSEFKFGQQLGPALPHVLMCPGGSVTMVTWGIWGMPLVCVTLVGQRGTTEGSKRLCQELVSILSTATAAALFPGFVWELFPRTSGRAWLGFLLHLGRVHCFTQKSDTPEL